MRILAVVLALVLSTSVFAKTERVELLTSEGQIILELYPDKAPKTVDNFIEYVRTRFYSETLFHRVIPGFMIQGGGFNVQGERKNTKAPIVNESDNGLSNERGTIAMARTNDPHSATSQFFINHANNPFLDRSTSSYGYTVFGRVVRGMEVVDKIAQVATRTNGMMRDWPQQPVRIFKAYYLD
ncbi:MAG: peptidyl-prolyl cis-trans isomerase [Gammaproteobacteria bacterium]|nr:peptidyl-prolyl cis-trans isomerase [Gammaproteobacteria bacterium]MCP4881649.1 peptidyl-prolyl cis-trans isomerase [Gammaproteobacteria bacterium]MDP6165527.1 peptidylprolyl isomerase [Gammaproteobacteria bacterium]